MVAGVGPNTAASELQGALLGGVCMSCIPLLTSTFGRVVVVPGSCGEYDHYQHSGTSFIFRPLWGMPTVYPDHQKGGELQVLLICRREECGG